MVGVHCGAGLVLRGKHTHIQVHILWKHTSAQTRCINEQGQKKFTYTQTHTRPLCFCCGSLHLKHTHTHTHYLHTIYTNLKLLHYCHFQRGCGG